MRPQLRRLSLAVFVLMLAITVAGTVTAKITVKDQESRLLRERTNEVALVLTSSISALPAPLDVLGGVLRATNESPSAFRQASGAAGVGSSVPVTFALIRKTPSGFVVAMATGGGVHAGQVITDQRSRAFEAALTSGKLEPTVVIGHGAGRALGFALGPPVAPAGTVLYRQDLLGPVGAPRSAGTAPFSELDVVIYATSRPDPTQVLAKTTDAVPLKGEVYAVPLAAGAATWTLQASAVHPLVGAATDDAPWIVLVGGLFLSALAALVIEIETRRRKAALGLYDAEHRVAESLQRSLLPILPTVSGVGMAARYLPGAAHQAVGGDWFDVFELDDGRVGLVIGDVVGHDIVAAAAMSKIQSALRAFALGGAPPAQVLDRLDAMISTFEISELATVFYGVLDHPDASGGRLLTYVNGGHLAPLMRAPDGRVETLESPQPLLLGAPRRTSVGRQQATAFLRAGSTVVLFTDGLVEVPGESLTISLARLASAVSEAQGELTADELCAHVLAGINPERLRDDVAVLVIGLVASDPHAPPEPRPPLAQGISVGVTVFDDGPAGSDGGRAGA